MEELSKIIGSNICQLRKKMNLTQLELSQKINYSDKSISKWEKGDGVPDIYVLKTLSEIFGVTVNDLITENCATNVTKQPQKSKKIIITLLSILIVWLVSVIAYVFSFWINSSLRCWLCFIYAIPASFIVAQVFASLWSTKFVRAFCATGISWCSILSIYLTFKGSSWMLFLVGIPFQVMIILWYLFIAKEKNKKS